MSIIQYGVFLVICILGFLLGRLVVRAFLNLFLGGTLTGGNFLWIPNERNEVKSWY